MQDANDQVVARAVDFKNQYVEETTSRRGWIKVVNASLEKRVMLRYERKQDERCNGVEEHLASSTIN